MAAVRRRGEYGCCSGCDLLVWPEKGKMVESAEEEKKM